MPNNRDRGKVTVKPSLAPVLPFRQATSGECPWEGVELVRVEPCANEDHVPFTHYHTEGEATPRFLSSHQKGIDCGRSGCPNRKE